MRKYLIILVSIAACIGGVTYIARTYAFGMISDRVVMLDRSPIIQEPDLVQVEVAGQVVDVGRVNRSILPNGKVGCFQGESSVGLASVTYDCQLVYYSWNRESVNAEQASTNAPVAGDTLILAPATLVVSLDPKPQIHIKGNGAGIIGELVFSHDPQHEYQATVRYDGDVEIRVNVGAVSRGAEFDVDELILSDLQVISRLFDVDNPDLFSELDNLATTPSIAEGKVFDAKADYQGQHTVAYLHAAGVKIFPSYEKAGDEAVVKLDFLSRAFGDASPSFTARDFFNKDHPLIVRRLEVHDAQGSAILNLGARLHADEDGRMTGHAHVTLPDPVSTISSVASALGKPIETANLQMLRMITGLFGNRDGSLDLHMIAKHGKLSVGGFDIADSPVIP